MQILLTGASGYVGKRLLPILLEEGHTVWALYRNQGQTPPLQHENLHLLYGDLSQKNSCHFPKGINAAYYLIHSMSDKVGSLEELEIRCAKNFLQALERTNAKQIIYLGGLLPKKESSSHLDSRERVAKLFMKQNIPFTILRAGILIGAGSASFEIIRDLVEKLPVMIAPRWVAMRTQPIAIADALFYLRSVLGEQRCLNQQFDVGGEEVLSFKELMLTYASYRNLKRLIISVPVLTPALSSLWLFFICSTRFSLARFLVSSMVAETICQDRKIQVLFPHTLLSYRESLDRAFQKIEQNAVASSWIDSWDLGGKAFKWEHYVEVPNFGCLEDKKEQAILCSQECCKERIWSIGGEKGWYCMNWAWKIRGWLDRIIGGVGLRRGRRHPKELQKGDALDFWRVIIANKEKGKLLLYAEMKLPGEAWLSFHIKNNRLIQKATFRPKGILGRAYWYLMIPAHFYIFRGLIKKLTEK